jgi:uncharacterized membrane protein
VAEETSGPGFEDVALTRSEYIVALSHLYRGELQRSITWRIRLDTTTNWALVSTIGIVTFAFNNPQYAPQTLLAGMYANFLFLMLEAQRFRFFDVYRSRVRMVEENFYVPLLRRDLVSPLTDWGPRVAEDLLHPCYHLTMRQAVRARLARIYLPLYLVLLAGWLAVVVWHPRSGRESTLDLLRIGKLPGWVPALLVAGLFAYVIYVVFFTPRVVPVPDYYVHVRSRGGDAVSELDT